MKHLFVSTKASLFTIVALITVMPAFVSTSRAAETVLSQTYSRSAPSNFTFTFNSLHDDDFAPGYSTLTVNLDIIIRDQNNNVVSHSMITVEHSGGQITVLNEVADDFVCIDHYQYESQNTGESEFFCTFECIPPGTLENYTVEVVLLKDRSDEDTHSVTYDVF